MTDIVLIHGWGCDSRCWDSLRPFFRDVGAVRTLSLPGFANDQSVPASVDALVSQLAAQLSPASVIVGWSLGAMLGVQLAHRYPEKVAALVSIAANASFVARDDYPYGMAPTTFAAFKTGFEQSPVVTLKRFYSLMSQGGAQERDLTKQLRHYMPACRDDSALALLNILGELDNRHALSELPQPHLQVLASQDALVPSEAFHVISSSSRYSSVMVNAPHSAPITHAPEVAKHLLPFLQQVLPQRVHNEALSILDKRKVARAFSNAAHSYDQMADLQRVIGDRLETFLPATLTASGAVVDVGAGTGYYTARLQQRYPQQSIIALDLAEGMLRYARRIHAHSSIAYVGGDAEQLPLQTASCALIFSNLALQWCRDVSSVWSEIYRCLAPGGMAVITTLGPATLNELKIAWATLDTHTHVNSFDDGATVTAAVRAAGLMPLINDCHSPVFYFPSLHALMAQLKGVGAQNSNQGARAGLTSASQLATLRAAYERYRTPDGLPATYEVYTLVVSRPISDLAPRD